jgi:hypothetical protein
MTQPTAQEITQPDVTTLLTQLITQKSAEQQEYQEKQTAKREAQEIQGLAFKNGSAQMFDTKRPPATGRAWLVVSGSTVCPRKSEVPLASSTMVINRDAPDGLSVNLLFIQRGFNWLPESSGFTGEFDRPQEKALRAMQKEGSLLILPPGAPVTNDLVLPDVVREFCEGLDNVMNAKERGQLEVVGEEAAGLARVFRFMAEFLKQSDDRRFTRIAKYARQFELDADRE